MTPSSRPDRQKRISIITPSFRDPNRLKLCIPSVAVQNLSLEK